MYSLSNETSFDRPVFSTAPSEHDFNSTKCHHTSHQKIPIHGVVLLNTLQSRFRSMWAINMLAAMVATAYFSYLMIRDFFQAETTTHITMLINESITYPNIHICPKNADHLNYDVVFEDVKSRLPTIKNSEMHDLILYFTAGIGIRNTGIGSWDHPRIESTKKLFNIWRMGRSIEDLYEFVFVQNGVNCSDILKSCKMAGRIIDCCDAFSSTYVMLRGRCIRLNALNQTGSGNTDFLRLDFNRVDSQLIDKGLQNQYVFYFGDLYPETAIFPRVYLTYNELGRMKITPRRINMIEKENVCNYNPIERGRSTCYVNRWVLENIIEPYNCTLVYLKDVHASKGYRICDADIIIRHYDQIIASTVKKYKCYLNCDRWDYYFQYVTKVYKYVPQTYAIEILYKDMVYEVYTEQIITSLPSFISQVGGQIVLFLGCSVISIVHFGSYLAYKVQKLYKKFIFKKSIRISEIEN